MGGGTDFESGDATAPFQEDARVKSVTCETRSGGPTVERVAREGVVDRSHMNVNLRSTGCVRTGFDDGPIRR